MREGEKSFHESSKNHLRNTRRGKQFTFLSIFLVSSIFNITADKSTYSRPSTIVTKTVPGVGDPLADGVFEGELETD